MAVGYQNYISAVDRYSDRAYTVALRLMGDEKAAEALAADAFVMAYEFYGGGLFLVALCRRLLAGTGAGDADEAALYLRTCMALDYETIAIILECETRQVRARIAAARGKLYGASGRDDKTAQPALLG